MSKQTLVVIDMQPYFPAYTKAVRGTILAIRMAKFFKQPIINVTYSTCGPIGKEIKKAIGKYKNVITISKGQDDGSDELLKALDKTCWPKRLRVCGVNTEACVRSTIDGLVWLGFKKNRISLIESACAGQDNLHKPTVTRLSKAGITIKKK